MVSMTDAAKSTEPKSEIVTRAAALVPGSLNEESRTVEIVWTTGARVKRYAWDIGAFYEDLVVTPRAVDMKRLNSGAPFLNCHTGAGDALRIHGSVIPGSAEIRDGVGYATVMFDDADNDPDAEKIFRKIRKGILRGVSVGYMPLEVKRTKEEVDGIPVFRVTKWEPFEVSVAPIQADLKSNFRSFSMENEEENTTPDPKPELKPEPVAQRTAPAQTPTTVPTVLTVNAEQVRAEERQRTKQIRTLCRTAKLDDSFADALIDSGDSIEAARSKVLDKVIAEEPDKSHGVNAAATGRDLAVESFRDGATNALLHRSNPGAIKLTDAGRHYRGLSLMEMAREHLASKGINVRGLSKNEIAGMALRANSTSDFPIITANIVNQTLRSQYEAAPQTFKPFSRRTTLTDYKPVTRVQLGDAPELKRVVEGGEYTRGTVSEQGVSYQLGKYGRIIAFTREMMINDDLDALSRLPMMFARRAADLESDLVWAQITSNPEMGDGKVLFHADHDNAGTGVLGLDAIASGELAMAGQVGLDGALLNLNPAFLAVPRALRPAARQFMSQNFQAAKTSDVNIYAGEYQIVSDFRLDQDDAEAWYLIADPGSVDIIEYAYLDGNDGPYLETRDGFEVDGVEMKVRHEFAARVIDWRGIYKSDGQAA